MERAGDWQNDRIKEEEKRLCHKAEMGRSSCCRLPRIAPFTLITSNIGRTRDSYILTAAIIIITVGFLP